LLAVACCDSGVRTGNSSGFFDFSKAKALADKLKDKEMERAIRQILSMH
jgi:hypothetical protein